MLMSVSRLLIVSSLSLLFALLVTHIPRIFVLETVKALSVLGKGDSRSIFLVVKSKGQTPSEYTKVSVCVNKFCIFFPADESTDRLTTASRALARCE